MRRVALGCSMIPLVVALLLPSRLSAGQGLSRVRVVRLSYTSGTGAVQRPGSTDWAQAVVNTPIQEGFDLETAAHSFAEVQFENGSTVRIGELSRIDFTQLAMDPQGNKLNRLRFEQGYATFHFVPEHHDVYAVTASGTTLAPKGKSEFRTDLDRDRLRLEVFEGSIEAASASGSVRVSKGMVTELGPELTAASNLRHGIEKDAWDKWSDARDIKPGGGQVSTQGGAHAHVEGLPACARESLPEPSVAPKRSGLGGGITAHQDRARRRHRMRQETACRRATRTPHRSPGTRRGSAHGTRGNAAWCALNVPSPWQFRALG